MFIGMTDFGRCLIGIAAAALFTASANGAIIYSFNGVTDAGGGQFDWEYTAQLSPDQKVDDAIGPNFGVIFDFLGVISATSTPLVGGIVLNTVLEATSAQPVGTVRPDGAGIQNVLTAITGTFNAATATDIFSVIVRSTVSDAVLAVNFQSAQAIKDNPGQPDDDTLAGSTVEVPGPGRGPDPNPIPEPATLALIGVGLMAAGLCRVRIGA